MKYASAAVWIFVAWLMRKIRLPLRWVHEVEDRASISTFDCSLDFEPIELAKPVGWKCDHFSITGSALAGVPTTSMCDCTMRPVFADS